MRIEQQRAAAKAPAERRAEAVRAPLPGRAMELARAEREAHLGAREAVERRRALRGLILLGLLVLAASLWRAGLGRAFVPGWWKQW